MSETIVIISPPVPIKQVVTLAQQGPPGPPSMPFMQNFTNSSSVLVNHNLGHYPSVTVLDTAGTVYLCAVSNLSLNSCVVSMAEAMTGTVSCL